MKTESRALETGALMIEEFERLPEEPCHVELARGQVIREPLGGFEHGVMAADIGALLLDFVTQHRLGAVVGASCGFVLFDEPPTVRAPDAAFIREERLTFDPKTFVPFAPDLSVEVLMPSDKASDFIQKIVDYLEAGTRMIWVVDPDLRTVTVYRSRDEIRILTGSDELEGADVLPGFRLKVSELFTR